MLATDKQIKYLCALADKVEKIKAINKSALQRRKLNKRINLQR